jgi:hypothetical protein
MGNSAIKREEGRGWGGEVTRARGRAGRGCKGCFTSDHLMMILRLAQGSASRQGRQYVM